MQKEGFSVIGCVPKSGVLAGIGWAESLILFHDLSVISEVRIFFKSSFTFWPGLLVHIVGHNKSIIKSSKIIFHCHRSETNNYTINACTFISHNVW